MGSRHYFRVRRTLVAVGGTYDDVEFGPILEDRLYHIARFGVEDETTAPSTDVRCYVKGHGYEHWLNEENSPAAGVLYWDVDGTFLVMGESLVARFTGADPADVLELYVEGWWEELGGPGRGAPGRGIAAEEEVGA